MSYKVPIISIVGKSNSGKTTLIEKIVKELKLRGYRVATIKHSHHNVELDIKGKDSWKHFQSGADAVIIATQKKIGLFRRTEVKASLTELVDCYLQDMDIIVLEGYKTENIPKIEVSRTKNSSELVCKDDKNLIAIVSDKDPDIGVLYINIDTTASTIVDFVLSKLKVAPPAMKI